LAGSSVIFGEDRFCGPFGAGTGTVVQPPETAAVVVAGAAVGLVLAAVLPLWLALALGLLELLLELPQPAIRRPAASNGIMRRTARKDGTHGARR
jgi:hypothetical protein